MGELAKFKQFKAELAIAETFEEIKFIESKAAAAAEFAKRNNIGKDVQDEWGIFRTEIWNKKGAWLKVNFPKSVRSKDRKSSVAVVATDKIMPVSEHESSDARLIHNEVELVKESTEEIKKSKEVVTPTKVAAKVRKKKKEKENENRENISNSFDNNIEKETGITSLKKGWFKIGNQYLYYGSNIDDIFLSFIPDCKFAFADPPYNAEIADWDKGFLWEQDYLQDIAEIVAVTPGGWNAYGFYQQTKMNYIWEMVCWIKNGMTHGRCGYANFIKASIFSNNKVKISQDFWDITIKTSETEETNHKGRKPYDFMIYLIDMFTKQGDNIVDPFAGSGTTLLVSEKMGRVSYNAEMDEKYCIKIIERALSIGMDYGEL